MLCDMLIYNSVSKLQHLNSRLLYSKLVSHFKYYHWSKYTHAKENLGCRLMVAQMHGQPKF